MRVNDGKTSPAPTNGGVRHFELFPIRRIVNERHTHTGGVRKVVKPRNVSSSVINLEIVGSVVESEDTANVAESWVSLWY